MVHSETYMEAYSSEFSPSSFKERDSPDKRDELAEETESGDSDDTSL